MIRPLRDGRPGRRAVRLNRSAAVGQLLIIHSLADLRSLSNEADRAEARGLAERAGAVLRAGLPLVS